MKSITINKKYGLVVAFSFSVGLGTSLGSVSSIQAAEGKTEPPAAVELSTIPINKDDSIPEIIENDIDTELVNNNEIVPHTPNSLKYSKTLEQDNKIEIAREEYSNVVMSACDPTIMNLPTYAQIFVQKEYDDLVRPVAIDKYRLTSPFGYRPNPFTGVGSEFHKGTDYAAPTGTPIYSVADGVVVFSDYDTGNGTRVVIQHENNGKYFNSGYVHMYDGSVYVKTGDKVKAGQHIADIGSKGRSTGPHLHFEIIDGADWTTGNNINPEQFLLDNEAVDISTACLLK